MTRIYITTLAGSLTVLDVDLHLPVWRFKEKYLEGDISVINLYHDSYGSLNEHVMSTLHELSIGENDIIYLSRHEPTCTKEMSQVPNEMRTAQLYSAFFYPTQPYVSVYERDCHDIDVYHIQGDNVVFVRRLPLIGVANSNKATACSSLDGKVSFFIKWQTTLASSTAWVEVWDTSNECINEWNHLRHFCVERVKCAVSNQDGTILVCTSENFVVYIDVSTGLLCYEATSCFGNAPPVVHPLHTHSFVQRRWKKVYVCSPTAKQETVIPGAIACADAVFSRCGSMLLLFNDRQLQLFAIDHDNETQMLWVHERCVIDHKLSGPPTFSFDEEWILASCDDKISVISTTTFETTAKIASTFNHITFANCRLGLYVCARSAVDARYTLLQVQ